MRVSCPNCLTEYDVPDAALAKPGRSLRCGHCGHQWQLAPPEDVAAVTVAPVDWASLPELSVPETLLQSAPVEERQFGKPVDEKAQDEIQLATEAETEPQPELNTATGLPLSGEFTPSEAETRNGFTDLIYAAKQKSMSGELEPEPEPVKPLLVRRSKALLILLVILFALGLVYMEHGFIMQHFPASAGFFHGLGLKS